MSEQQSDVRYRERMQKKKEIMDARIREASDERGVVIVNTARGAVIDTPAVIEGLKAGRIGGLGMDVYEHEGALYFEDRSDEVLTDDLFARLLGFHNVVITGHQAFLTHEALDQIASQTLQNLTCIETGTACEREITPTDTQAD